MTVGLNPWTRSNVIYQGTRPHSVYLQELVWCEAPDWIKLCEENGPEPEHILHFLNKEGRSIHHHFGVSNNPSSTIGAVLYLRPNIGTTRNISSKTTSVDLHVTPSTQLNIVSTVRAVFSRPPPAMVLKGETSISRVETFVINGFKWHKTKGTQGRSQTSYKHNYYNILTRQTEKILTDDWVFPRLERLQERENSHKLAAVTEGPYRYNYGTGNSVLI